MDRTVWYSTPEALRHRPHVGLTLPRDVLEKLARLAGPGGSRSAVVERLIIEAPERSEAAPR